MTHDFGRRQFLDGIIGLAASAVLISTSAFAAADRPSTAQRPSAKALKLIAGARAQLGVTVLYDPAYVRIAYPNGDVPRDRGVCTDVVIRAYRQGLGVDLQELVHEDMQQNFSSYPKIWGLKKTDSHIDHRRVPNLQAYFARHNGALSVSQRADDY